MSNDPEEYGRMVAEASNHVGGFVLGASALRVDSSEADEAVAILQGVVALDPNDPDSPTATFTLVFDVEFAAQLGFIPLHTLSAEEAS